MEEDAVEEVVRLYGDARRDGTAFAYLNGPAAGQFEEEAAAAEALEEAEDDGT